MDATTPTQTPAMTVSGTPVEYHKDLGLWVKREDLCCPRGPHFSKCRGVFAHALKRPESLLRVLDTSHSRGGHAVARAAQILGKKCVVYYPVTAKEPTRLGDSQISAARCGAELQPLPATASWALYNYAKRDCELRGGYMFPNALKLIETVEETKQEVLHTTIPGDVTAVLVSASSGTIAAGVMAGLSTHPELFGRPIKFIVHLGYSRPPGAVRNYIYSMSGWGYPFQIVDEGYHYADEARPGPTPEFPCDRFYDLKAVRWAIQSGMSKQERVFLWNVG